MLETCIWILNFSVAKCWKSVFSYETAQVIDLVHFKIKQEFVDYNTKQYSGRLSFFHT